MYQKNIVDGYIVSVVKSVDNGNITEAEYNTIIDVIRNKPKAEDGYDYRLKENLTWELHEVPVVPPEEEEATEEDYKNALNTLGVNTDEER